MRDPSITLHSPILIPPKVGREHINHSKIKEQKKKSQYSGLAKIIYNYRYRPPLHFYFWNTSDQMKKNKPELNLFFSNILVTLRP